MVVVSCLALYVHVRHNDRSALRLLPVIYFGVVFCARGISIQCGSTTKNQALVCSEITDVGQWLNPNNQLCVEFIYKDVYYKIINCDDLKQNLLIN